VAFITHYTGVHLPAGYIGLAPVSDTLINASVVVRAAHLAATKKTSQAFFTQTLQAHPELRQRFAQAIHVKNPLTIGPIAQRLACPHQDDIMFIGDATSFFDSFTGQGIYLALHSAILAAAVAHRALCSSALSADGLRSYCLAHRQAFRDKYRLSALIQLGLHVPRLANRVIDCLACRPALADIVVGVAGNFVLPKAVLSWRFATQVFM
jgi:flavin-dependent dehydrogenase